MYEKKYKSIIVIWGAMLLILQALALIDVIGLRPQLYNQLSKLEISFVAVGMIGVITSYMILSLHKKKSGPYIGMLAGMLYIMSLNIINIIAGIFFIIYCAWMIKELSSTESTESTESTKNTDQNNAKN